MNHDVQTPAMEKASSRQSSGKDFETDSDNSNGDAPKPQPDSMIIARTSGTTNNEANAGSVPGTLSTKKDKDKMRVTSANTPK